MIFTEEHINKIRKGHKTQTRRVNRGIYQVGRSYCVQPKRGVKSVPDIRIVMDEITQETSGRFISIRDAWAEGRYTPWGYERVFQNLNPKYDRSRDERWAFKFHIEKKEF